MSLHECPECGNEVVTNSTTGGAFSLPPRLHCVHEGRLHKMDIVDEAMEAFL